MVTRAREAKRHLRVFAYLLFTAAGPLAIAYTPPVMGETVGAFWAMVWGWFILVGGGGCLVGSLTDRWVGEYLFLHLLGSAVALYAACAFASAEQDLGRTVSGVLVTATTVLLVDRWLDVRAVARAATMTAGDTCDRAGE